LIDHLIEENTMKYIKPIALAASILALSSGNAVAEEIEFQPPDIAATLNMMVEKKMDRLTRKIVEHREDVYVAEQVNNDFFLMPAASGKETGYVSVKTGS